VWIVLYVNTIIQETLRYRPREANRFSLSSQTPLQQLQNDYTGHWFTLHTSADMACLGGGIPPEMGRCSIL